MNFLKKLRPATLDACASHSRSPLAAIWRGLRSVVFVDLIVYNAIAFGLILPFIFGGSFALGGGVLAALAVSAAFFVFSFAFSAVCTTLLRVSGLTVRESARETRVQWCLYAVAAMVFFGLCTHFLPGVLSVSGPLTYVLSAACLWLVGAWAYNPSKN